MRFSPRFDRSLWHRLLARPFPPFPLPLPVTFQPETPYLSADLAPADIREDFAGLAFEAGYDPQTLLEAMACWLPTATLADFMDDFAMGRV